MNRLRVRRHGAVVLLGALLAVQGGEAVRPPPDDPYLIARRSFGTYEVRLEWPRDAPDLRWVPVYGKVLSIWREGRKHAETEWVLELDPRTGEDVTGDGYPDVIVVHYSGGAHCCYELEVFSLGPHLARYTVPGGGNCQGEFVDLDGDGVYEVITCDDAFAYTYCPFACSPLVRVVLRFVPGTGYVPASPDFPELYAEDIAAHTELAAEGLKEGPFCSWDGTPKCAVLALVLDLLYSGQAKAARAAFDRYYRYPDAPAFWEEVLATVRQSPLFTQRGTGD
ncbi:MAG: VCBS repeat-containing protein [Candidatus Bipolaricaulota bacterium]|nr:VCBS repeat-containing protein [Candidatus Bipolaricaulota bacterium]